jgi:hypothetical protein
LAANVPDKENEHLKELRVLIRVLRGALPDPECDWELAVGLARRHGVSPFLCYLLRQHRDSVPAHLWQAMQSDYYAAVASHLLRERQLEQVLEALDRAGVPVVLLKGAALSLSVYPDPALRTMGDLDLWVLRSNLDGARVALNEIGYVAHSKANRPLPLQDTYLGETQMLSDEPGMRLVELHWNVFPGEWLRHTGRIDEEPLWERRVPLDGTTSDQLAPEDAVFHTCLHYAISHQMSGLGLRPFIDLELIQKRYQINWDSVMQRARAWRVQTAMWLVLDRWAELFDHMDDVPVNELCPSLLRQGILHRFVSFQSLLEGKALRRGLARRAYLLFLVDRVSDVALILWRTFFPEREWLTLLYGLEGAPGWRIRLQQLYHPFRVLLQGDI